LTALICIAPSEFGEDNAIQTFNFSDITQLKSNFLASILFNIIISTLSWINPNHQLVDLKNGSWTKGKTGIASKRIEIRVPDVVRSQAMPGRLLTAYGGVPLLDFEFHHVGIRVDARQTCSAYLVNIAHVAWQPT
jgi:hypothetical protein